MFATVNAVVSNRPNVLFFFPDQYRHDWVGFDGDVPVKTPALDSLAAEGVAFRNAVCPSPLCGPSRACLASGYEYDRCGVRNHDADYPFAAPTYYEHLRDQAGYHVIGCGKFDLQKHSGDWGLDGKNNLAANGFSDGINNAGYWDAFGSATDTWGGDSTYTGPNDPYMAYLDDQGFAETHIEDLRRRRWETGRDGPDIDATFPTPLPAHAYCDNWIAHNGLELLADAPEDRPWHLIVNFAGPHNPWDVTEEMYEWYRNPDVDFPERVEPGEMPSEKSQDVRRNYAAMCENYDRWLARYREHLKERGEWENTLVVFASDHGEMLGDRGQWNKRSPYHPSVGVPFVIAGPGIESRGVVDEPASVLDLHATLLDVAGVDPGDVDSRSLLPYLAGRTDNHRQVAHSGIGNWRLALDERYKLIRGYDPDRSANEQVGECDAWSEAATKNALGDRSPILLNRHADPKETENVADAHPGIVERLTESITAVRGESSP